MNKEYLKWIREVLEFAKGYRQDKTFFVWLGGCKSSVWRQYYLDEETPDAAAWHLLPW